LLFSQIGRYTKHASRKYSYRKKNGKKIFLNKKILFILKRKITKFSPEIFLELFQHISTLDFFLKGGIFPISF